MAAGSSLRSTHSSRVPVLWKILWKNLGLTAVDFAVMARFRDGNSRLARQALIDQQYTSIDGAFGRSAPGGYYFQASFFVFHIIA
jgi:hypothetical protein